MRFLFAFLLVATPLFAQDGTIPFKVDDQERQQILQQIQAFGKNIGRYIKHMTKLADSSKKNLTSAFHELHPVTSNYLVKTCLEGQKKTLIERSICFRNQLETILSDIEYAQKRSPSFEATLIQKNHPIGKIIFEQCEADPTPECWRENLELLREQHLSSFNSMVASIDDLARWSIYSSACGQMNDPIKCAKAKVWKEENFIPTTAEDLAYSPKRGLPEPMSGRPPVLTITPIVETKPLPEMQEPVCTPESIKQYRVQSRLPMDMLNYIEVLEGQQFSFACRVAKYHGQNEGAKILARMGLFIVYVAKYMNEMSQGQYRELVTKLFSHLNGYAGNETYDALKNDLQFLNTISVKDLPDTDFDSMISKNFCPWKQQLESEHRGSTAGFSSLIISCD